MKGDLIFFDIDKYEHDLRMKLKNVTKEIRDHLKDELVHSVRLLPLKSNEVRLAGGYVTSDKDRERDLIDSIITDRLESYESKFVRTAVSAMANNFNNSHIGIYYEFGTGIYAEDVPLLKMLGDPNPYRKGRDVVSRSRKAGTWRDAGGNIRTTGSFLGGSNGGNFRKYIGDDVRAYHWFSNTFNKVIKEEAIPKYWKAIQEISPLKYLIVKKKFILGVD
jgi:hypothetical protein